MTKRSRDGQESWAFVSKTVHQELIEKLARAAAPVLATVGLELVELSLRGSSRRRLLRIDIDRAGPDGVNLEDCKRASQALDPVIEDSGLLPGAYLLEVSSPGADRLIQSPDDFRRNVGRRVEVWLDEAVEGQMRWTGVLRGVQSGCVLLELAPRKSESAEARMLSIALERVQRMHQEIGFGPAP